MTVLRVLICEGSRGFAVRLRRVLEHDGDISVAAVCATAKQAIDALPMVQPDVVTLELPGTGGQAAIEESASARPLPFLGIYAEADSRGETAAAALAAGALDAIGRDDLDVEDPGAAAAAAFRQRVRDLSYMHG